MNDLYERGDYKSQFYDSSGLQRFEQREQSEACFNYAESQKTTKSLESGT